MATWHRWLIGLCVVFPLLACGQDIGGRCQVNSDCASGNCVVEPGSRLVGGFCEPAEIVADGSVTEEDTEGASAIHQETDAESAP